MIYVAKISYRDAGGTAQTAWFTNGQGWRTRSTDTPASTLIEGRLINPGTVQRSMFKDAAAFGAIEAGYGAAVLLNSDGGLDSWRSYYLAGNEYEVFALTAAGEPSSSWTSVLKLRMRFVQLGLDTMTIALRDRLQELETPLAKNFFAGTGGLEGQSYVANVRKPWGVGDCFMCEPIFIDAPGGTHLVYVVSENAFDSATIGRQDRYGGTNLSRDANYASEAALFSTPPTGASYAKRWPAGGALAIGAARSGSITSDISFGGTTDKLVHRCLEACALRAGISSGDISSADLTALDASPTINAGYYVRDAETALSVMTKLANGGGLWFGFDRAGVLRFGKVDTYSGSAAYAFTEHNTVEGGIVRDVSGGLTAPIWSLTLRWRKRWRPLDNLKDTALITGQDLMMPWDEVTVTDSTTKTNNPHAQSVVRDSYCMNLDLVAAPSTEASRQLTLFKALRAVYRVTARISAALLSVDLGNTVSLTHSRFGLTSATNFKVIGSEFDFGADRVTYMLWG